MTTKEAYEIFGGNYDEVIERLGTDSLIVRFFGKFKEDDSMEKLVDAVEKGDIEQSFRAAHTLKGVAANLSMTNLANAASNLTEQLRDRSNTADEQLFQAVKIAYAQVIDVIDAFEA